MAFPSFPGGSGSSFTAALAPHLRRHRAVTSAVTTAEPVRSAPRRAPWPLLAEALGREVGEAREDWTWAWEGRTNNMADMATTGS